MIALYRQELRKLWPIALLGFLLLSGDVLYRPFTELLDQMRWEEIASYIDGDGAGSLGWVILLLAWTTAYSAFVREQDERTLGLLIALPVRRPTIFVAKVLGGLSVLGLIVTLLACSDGWMGSRNGDSIEGGHFRLEIALVHLAVQLVFAGIVYAHGLLASVFRRIGILPYALVLVVTSILEDPVPILAWVDPTELLVVRYDGASPRVSWLPFLVHAAFAGLALIAAYGAWLGPASGISQNVARARASWAARLGCGCLGLISLIGLATLAVFVADLRPEAGVRPEAAAPTETPSLATTSQPTERYDFVFPDSHADRAAQLIGEADVLHRRVQELLDTDPGPRIAADLTEQSREHRGISSWTHVRVGLAAEPSLAGLRHTFTHETVHAFQHRLSDDQQGTESRATRWFAEGSAEWVTFELLPDEVARGHSRWMAAAAWHHHGLRFEDLIDDERLRARFDTTLVYSLGELLVDAMSEACGRPVVGDALRAMAREDAPEDLSPRAFWAANLASVGCDIEAVDATFEARMEREVESRREAIEALPRLGAGGLGGGRVAVVARGAMEPGWQVVARARRGPESDDSGVVGVRAREVAPGRYELTVPRALLGASRFQIMLGVLMGEGWLWSETWQWVAR